MLHEKKDNTALTGSDLGKKSDYDAIYNPDKLFAIPRKIKRDEINISSTAPLPFYGYDTWNHYEVSWLNQKGKPMVAMATLIYPCESPNIIESKSMKLYFNSFNNTKFNDVHSIREIIEQDITKRVGAKTNVALTLLKDMKEPKICNSFEGKCIDECDVECTAYTVDSSLLSIEEKVVTNEILYSDLLKSNCLVTNQPDWGSVQIIYSGRKINEAGLLKYLVSFRNHNEFHEQCIERIFMDILRECKVEKLTVHGKYTRRGGIDINPFRTTEKSSALLTEHLNVVRLYRQ